MTLGSHLGHAIGDLRDLKLRRNLFVDVFELAVLFESLDPIAQVVVSQSLLPRSFQCSHHTKASTLVGLCLGERDCGILAAGRPNFEEKKPSWLIPLQPDARLKASLTLSW